MDATRLCRLEGVLRRYAWGSRTAIPALRGEAPSEEPQAELWFGAHRDAPATALAPDGESIALDAWIRRDPEALLGSDAARRGADELPFLLKLLAADAPLSIQAHPNAEQARAGHARENEAGLAEDAPTRCYRDANPKPELIVALTPFRALNGFRPPREIAERIAALGVAALEPFRDALGAASDSAALERFFRAWMSQAPDARRESVAAAVAAAQPLAARDPLLAEVLRLARDYPGDAGVLAPLFLQCVELEPGEAMFLPAGRLHSYLGGLGLELMASSDNVLRGGLTQKHVDVPELLATLRFDAEPVERLRPVAVSAIESRYETPAETFRLSRLRVADAAKEGAWEAAAPRDVEILLCSGGQVRLRNASGALDLRAGQGALAPAAAGPYRVSGEGEVFRARPGVA